MNPLWKKRRLTYLLSAILLIVASAVAAWIYFHN